MSYRIPLKTVTDPKKITITLVFIYISITAFLVLNKPANTTINMDYGKPVFSQNATDHEQFILNKNVYFIDNN